MAPETATFGTPTSTYRLQVRAGFTLDDAAATVDYLRRLGIGWVYLSPILHAEPGSDHGYDVIDHSTIDPARGGADALARLSEAAHGAGLGVLVDIVPNHMGVATPSANAWWWDVLKNGREAEHATAFDIDWDAGNGRLRIPVLGDDGDELDHLVIDGDALVYYEHRFPLAPGTGDGSARDVHDRQHYELIPWRLADSELNYRRFFAVNSLAAIRVEEPQVFEDSHVEIRRWFDESLVDGLRVDHPDGLLDPGRYLDDLARVTGGAPVWVEKILEGDEPLHPSWATEGTTGYDALARIDRVFVDRQGRRILDAVDGSLGDADVTLQRDWTELIHTTKRGIADGILGSEVNRLARLAPEVDDARDAIAELLACFPVYRSYLPYGAEHVEDARLAALTHRPDIAPAIEAIAKLLLDADTELSARFQQTSGMVMAKGVEDTAFYRYIRLSSLNEVGADPSEFAISVDEFHRHQETRQAALPNSMTTLSTHDTKRGEDTRARITALSERADQWSSTLADLHRIAGIGDGPVEHLLWEATVGAWPISRERLHAYAEKAAREEGTSTNWSDPDPEFEARLHDLVDSVFDNDEIAALVTAAAHSVDAEGWSNGLSAKLVQLTAPGIPDVYQGSELWEQSLVDPDNRRAVDFDERVSLLDRLDDGWLPPIDESGAAKLLVTARALRLRREHPERFALYRAVPVYGAAAHHVIAFDRGGAITVATRLPFGLHRSGGWGETTIELGNTDVVDVITGTRFAGGVLRVADVLHTYPVALLTPVEGVVND